MSQFELMEEIASGIILETCDNTAERQIYLLSSVIAIHQMFLRECGLLDEFSVFRKGVTAEGQAV